jgi:hypothetical protein
VARGIGLARMGSLLDIGVVLRERHCVSVSVAFRDGLRLLIPNARAHI